jgi:hypothetical protein
MSIPIPIRRSIRRAGSTHPNECFQVLVIFRVSCVLKITQAALVCIAPRAPCLRRGNALARGFSVGADAAYEADGYPSAAPDFEGESGGPSDALPALGARLVSDSGLH